MSKQLEEIQETLLQKAEKSNVDFFGKMVPGKQKIYGVKTQHLNELVKKYRPGSFTLARELWQSGALEEKIIAIKIIEKEGRKDPTEVLTLFKQFAKNLDNWAVCDGLGMQFLRGIIKTHSKEIFSIAEKFNRSPDPWQRRLSLVMVEWYTRDKQFTPQIKKLVKQLEADDEYYVKKAIVWINRNFSKNK